MKDMEAHLTLESRTRLHRNALVRHRARSILFPSTQEGQSIVLQNLARRSYPTLDFFVYAILSGIFLAAGFLLD